MGQRKGLVGDWKNGVDVDIDIQDTPERCNWSKHLLS
jgi:hypothetical protein